MLHLLSYPRSGNHLVRFMIEYISSCPTLGCSPRDVPLCENAYPNIPDILDHVSKDTNRAIVQKAHKPKFIFEKPSALIILVRDYKECVVQFNKGTDLEDYVDILDYYEVFDGPKKCIFYEDLLMEPTNVVCSIYTFLSHLNLCRDDTYLRKFLEGHREYILECSAGKGRSWGGLHSNFHLQWHRWTVSYAQRQKMDEEIKKKDTERLVQRYYQTPNVFTIVVKGGLCNRLRCLLSHARKYTHLHVYWIPDDFCPGRFHDLFCDITPNIVCHYKKPESRIHIDYEG